MHYMISMSMNDALRHACFCRRCHAKLRQPAITSLPSSFHSSFCSTFRSKDVDPASWSSRMTLGPTCIWKQRIIPLLWPALSSRCAPPAHQDQARPRSVKLSHACPFRARYTQKIRRVKGLTMLGFSMRDRRCQSSTSEEQTVILHLCDKATVAVWPVSD